MKKFLFTFLLFSCFFLLNGLSHVHQERTSYSPIQNLTRAGYAVLGLDYKDQSLLPSNSILFQKADTGIRHIDIEEVENELTSPEKYLKNGILFPFILFTLTFGYLLYSIKSNSGLSDHFTYPLYLCDRVISFRSIRI